MKSIKEKSEERAPYTKKDSWDRIKAAINAQTSFEAGANYVLDAIQSCIDRHEDGCLALEAIILTIDELKRNNYGIPQ